MTGCCIYKQNMLKYVYRKGGGIPMGNTEMIITEAFSALEDGMFSLNFATNGLGVIVYVLQALALYAIAQRRGIKKAWLAWIPLVNVWILGSLSDQYQYVVKGQVKNKRKTLLGLNIAILALTIVITTVLCILIAKLLMMGLLSRFPNNVTDLPWNALAEYVIPLLILLLTALPLTVLSIIQAVFFYIALYDVFCSCDPKNSTLYTVLSIFGNFVVNGVYALFLFLCKDKELGMPPRKAGPTFTASPDLDQSPFEQTEE